jgi:serine/threonine-protein kinase RsbW
MDAAFPRRPSGRADAPAGATTITLPAAVGSVPAIRRLTARAARANGADDATCEVLLLAVSEAATNAVLHAYPDEAGTVHLRIAREDGGIAVTVCDDGRGLPGGGESPGLGMGMAIIAEVADRLEIDSDRAAGTEVRMWFSLSRRRGRRFSAPSGASATGSGSASAART